MMFIVDLRYVVDGQLLDIDFEAHRRRFRVTSEDSVPDFDSKELSKRMNGLSLSQSSGLPSISGMCVTKVIWTSKVVVKEGVAPTVST
jgi:hypothetical protein